MSDGPPRYEVSMEVACLQCGRFAGTVPIGNQTPIRKRCKTCNGNLFRTGNVVRKLIETALALEGLEKRKGRPPKWLVAQRAQQQPS